METAVAEIARAREEFLASGQVPTDAPVRAEIVASWRRSVQHGLTPQAASPVESQLAIADPQILRATRPVIDARRQILRDLRCGITLTDSEGRLLARWVDDSVFARRLDSRLVHPGFSISEPVIGTNSAGIALELGDSVQVSGPEHFAAGATQMTTAGSPVRHPVTRRMAGTINIVAEFADSSPVLLAWIREVASAIERTLSGMVSRRERLLLDAYLDVVKDTRHPVICIDDQTIISNAAAARLVGTMDQPILWELASATAQGEKLSAEPIVLSGGETVLASCSPVGDGTSTIGAVIRLKKAPDADRAPVTAGLTTDDSGASSELPGLVGSSPAWREFCQRANAGFQQSRALAVLGEPGSGKTAIAHALTSSAAAVETVAPEHLRQALNGSADVLVVEGLEAADHAQLSMVMRTVGNELPAGMRIVATYTTAPSNIQGSSIPDVLMDWPGAVVRVPPLRERLGDLAELLEAITRSEFGRVGGPRWLAETVQTLTRLRWQQNLKSLQALVRSVLAGKVTAYVKVSDLPSRIQAHGARRQLAGLETAEAVAIAEALDKANGNKKLAADSLGIARSTLYRKVRALGLDLSVWNF
jgi:transcriptional regulator of acetoin/glycerol metabolism